MKKKSVQVIIISILSIFFLYGMSTSASAGNDFIIILDTSLSMIGQGGGSTLPKVKKSLANFIDNELDDDDSLTFMTFDTDVTVYPTFYIYDDNDKEIVSKMLEPIKAKGQWTYTSRMINVALKKAQELENKDEDRQKVIVVMTDTLDDPPPWRVNDKDNIKKWAKQKEWFLFVMNFGDLKQNKKMTRRFNKLAKYTKIIDAQKGQEAIEKELPKSIREMEARREAESAPVGTIIFIIVVLGLAAGGLYYLKNYAFLRVYGKLEYWDHTIISPYNRTVDLSKQNLRELTVGKQGSVRITEIDINNPFIISAVRESGEVKIAIQAGKGHGIEFVNRDPGNYLENGDMFKVANFTFKYASS